MAYFLKSGNSYKVSSKEALDLHDKLPAGNYVIKEDAFGNLYLQTIDDFEIRGKTYGDHTKNRDRILNTFQDRPNTTGVMLTGEKGSGKSLLAKSVSIQGAALGMPTIVINAPWAGDKFNSFLQSIDQPTIILFDEFEKVYPSEAQEQILTLLDGVFPSKKLFLLTCNDKWRVDSHMRNRPGRIYYMMDFKGLTADFIIEYCHDNLKAIEHVDRICQIASLFTEFNFDMLKALVEEMNRYGENPQQALKMLNAKPEFDQGATKYTVELSIEGIPLDKGDMDSTEWKGNPLQSNIRLNYKEYEDGLVSVNEDEDDDSNWDWTGVRFTPGDLKKIDSQNGKFIFVNEDNSVLTLTKVQEKVSYYYDAL